MPRVGAKTAIVKPSRLQGGYYFVKCRRYQSASGTFYDYCLMGRDKKTRKLQQRGPRQALSYNFPLRGGGQERIDIHRLFAMNSKLCNVSGLRWSAGNHVHHHANPRWQPWSNCTAANLIVWSARDHARWHRLSPDVPRCRGKGSDFQSTGPLPANILMSGVASHAPPSGTQCILFFLVSLSCRVAVQTRGRRGRQRGERGKRDRRSRQTQKQTQQSRNRNRDRSRWDK